MKTIRTTLLQIKNLFCMPTADALAVQQLANAERELLKAQELAEYYAAMVNMYDTQVDRLRHRVAPAAQLASMPKSLLKVAA